MLSICINVNDKWTKLKALEWHRKALSKCAFGYFIYTQTESKRERERIALCHIFIIYVHMKQIYWIFYWALITSALWCMIFADFGHCCHRHGESTRNAKWTLHFDLVSTCNWIGSLTKMPLPLLLLLNANRLHLICELFIKLVNGIQIGYDNVDTKTSIWQESIHAIGYNRHCGFGIMFAFWN